MCYNNPTYLSTAKILFLALIIIVAVRTTAHNRAQIIEDVPKFILDSQGGKWAMNVQIAHHNVKLSVKMDQCRSWIKEGLCQVCNLNGQQCSNSTSCFSSPKDPKISCDSAFCSRNGDYENSLKGIYGIETQMFCKAGNSDQTLMPIVLANKISEASESMGQFCLIDPDSSFSHGLVKMNRRKIEIINMNLNKVQETEVRETSFESSEVSMGDDLGFGQGSSVTLTNFDSQQYKPVVMSKEDKFFVQFSMEQLGISIPIKLLNDLEKNILTIYFPQNSCHIAAGKIKCRDQIKFGGLTEAILQFQFLNSFVFALPLHLLISSCGAKQCSILMTSHGKEDVITIGTIIWETISLEWDIKAKKLWVHRLNNQWASPFKGIKMDVNKRGFLANMLILLYHIFYYFFAIIIILVGISLLINCLIRWQDVLRYFRTILAKIRKRKYKELKQSEHEDQFFIRSTFQEYKTRKIHKLPDNLQEEI